MFKLFRKEVQPSDSDEEINEMSMYLPPEFLPPPPQEKRILTTTADVINRLDIIEAKIDKLLENEN